MRTFERELAARTYDIHVQDKKLWFVDPRDALHFFKFDINMVCMRQVLQTLAKPRQGRTSKRIFPSPELSEQKESTGFSSRFFNRMPISAFTLQGYRTIMHLFFTSSCPPAMKDSSGLSPDEWTRKTNNPSERPQQPQRERAGRKKNQNLGKTKVLKKIDGNLNRK